MYKEREKHTIQEYKKDFDISIIILLIIEDDIISKTRESKTWTRFEKKKLAFSLQT